MHDHREILALAAAAIDFELGPVEHSQLNAALETCHLCRRQAAEMRATATILRRPSDIGTPDRVRDVVIGAALRSGRRKPPWRSLLAASLSLLVVLGGTAVIVGNHGLNILPPSAGSAPIQTAAAPAGPPASPSAAAQSSPTASPIPTEPVPSSPAETAPAFSPLPVGDGPLRAGEIAAMVSDGRLVIRSQPETGANSAIFKTKLYPGQRVLTIEGPVEASGYPWFRVRLGVIEGWVAAASLDGEPWLAPVRNGLIAFVRDANDASGEAIYTVGPDATTGEALLLADPSLVHYKQLIWSPDGRRLAFVGTLADSLNGSSEIFVIDADGSNLVQLTQNEVDDDSPAWSPDSTQIAFRQADLDASAPVDSSVVVIGAYGSGARVLGPGANPAWSPDGLQLAMTVWDGSFTRIWAQAAGGGDRRQVSDASVASAPPAWSPDGQHLVVSSSGLILIEVASGSITPLTAEPGSMPAWSIGGMIAFSTTGSASPGVFVVASDGSGLRRVSGDLRFATAPEWSPDGRWLLLGGEGGSPVAVVDPGSRNLTVLGNDDGTIRSPAWQPRLSLTILDTLGVASPATSFSVYGAGGASILDSNFVGPRFPLTQRTVIAEIGGFINVMTGTMPVVVQIRPSVNGAPDPATVLGTYVLSNDNDPLLFSYESVAPNLTLGAGTYFALFAPQDGGEGSLLCCSSSPYVYRGGSIMMGFFDPIAGTSWASDQYGAVRIVGRL